MFHSIELDSDKIRVMSDSEDGPLGRAAISVSLGFLLQPQVKVSGKLKAEAGEKIFLQVNCP